jgi:hypothetical protein
VKVGVWVAEAVALGVELNEGVAENDGLEVALGVTVEVAVEVAEFVAVKVGENVGVGVGEKVAVGESVGENG